MSGIECPLKLKYNILCSSLLLDVISVRIKSYYGAQREKEHDVHTDLRPCVTSVQPVILSTPSRSD